MRTLLLATGFSVLLVSTALGQTQLPNPGLQIQFAPPGARALGMGATFVAIADDATAAASNPSGLIILSRPEVSGQFRASSFDTPSPFGPDTPNSQESVASIAFASFVYPSDKFAFGLYYQQPTNFKADFGASWSNFDPEVGGVVNESLSKQEAVKFENFGASAAFKLGKTLALGASIRGTRVTRTSSFSYSYAPTFIPGTQVTFTDSADGSPTELSFNAGLLVNPNGRWSLGAMYSYGPEVNIDRSYSIQRSGIFVDPPDYPASESGTDEPSPFNVPDTYGAGIAIRPSDRWVISAEVLGIKYSDLETKVLPGEEPDLSRLRFPDRAEFHAGAEYTLMAGKTPVSLRAGYYYDPDHDGVEELDTTQHHGTFGAGFVFNNKFQMDFAANLAKYVKEGLVSVVLRF